MCVICAPETTVCVSLLFYLLSFLGWQTQDSRQMQPASHRKAVCGPYNYRKGGFRFMGIIDFSLLLLINRPHDGPNPPA